MMRLAPSSVNSQPWRALVVGDTVHFYYTPKSNLSLIDCGIGLCHFYEDERFHGHAGRFSEIRQSARTTSRLEISYLLYILTAITD